MVGMLFVIAEQREITSQGNDTLTLHHHAAVSLDAR
jgi:hypothetical protein